MTKKKNTCPRFVAEGYVIPDENGYWGTEGARLKPDAPQWAKDEYAQWRQNKDILDSAEQKV